LNIVETKELDLRNPDIVTEVADKGSLLGVDTSEPWEICTITFNTGVLIGSVPGTKPATFSRTAQPGRTAFVRSCPPTMGTNHEQGACQSPSPDALPAP